MTDEYPWRIAPVTAETIAQSKGITDSRRSADVNHSVMHDRGYMNGWRDGIEWLARASGPIHWDAQVVELFVRLLTVGVARTGYAIDHAIDSARAALRTDEDGAWPDPDTTHGWGVLEPHVLRFLDLTEAELAAVA